MPRFNPPAPAVTGPVIRLAVQSVMDGQLYECLLDYMATAPLAVTPVILGAFIASWRATNEANWLASQAAQAVLQNYVAAEVAFGVVPSTAVLGLNAPGTVVVPPLPGTVAVVVTKGSILKGQHGRGRLFRYGIPGSFVTPLADPNLVNAVGLAAYATTNADLVVPLTAGGAVWQLAISTRPIAPLSLVATAIPVSSLTTVAVFATVRRRRFGRGI
jgi:hypothetical protein